MKRKFIGILLILFGLTAFVAGINVIIEDKESLAISGIAGILIWVSLPIFLGRRIFKSASSPKRSNMARNRNSVSQRKSEYKKCPTCQGYERIVRTRHPYYSRETGKMLGPVTPRDNEKICGRCGGSGRVKK